MEDAGIEAKRDRAGLSVRLGPHQARVNDLLREARQERVISRIWARDATLWKDDSSHQKIITNSLGWLTVPGEMLAVTDELKEFTRTVQSRGFKYAMVCGMGGSSLCPEVLRYTFGATTQFPELLVLDSTDPDTVDDFARQIDLKRCLFVIASKSGTTTEPVAFHRYWYNEASRVSSTPGDLFIAVTDPGTLMAETAAAERFTKIFLNQPDIGGRYSALSYFGMVPAALMGLDVGRLLETANVMATASRSSEDTNPAAELGAIMAECALSGRDKLTIVANGKLARLGLWIEQLVAESTGKEGKGIVPVVGESLGAPSVYSDDRLFVSISVGELEGESQSTLKMLEDAGHPVVYRKLNNLYELGAEFFLWEMATAFAGWRLKINPFDQPNVQEAKNATKALLEKYERDGKLDAEETAASDGTLSVYSSQHAGLGSVRQIITRHIASAGKGDYVTLLVYLEESGDTDAALATLRTSLRARTGCATTSGYGPRYLHSTGQLHKGGPNSGVFIQITAPDNVDLDVPGAPYTFSTLKEAQAQGDLQALKEHDRRVIRVDLGSDVQTGFDELISIVGKHSY
jgi:transaldolase/glucose-6-phosphate isomerase